MCLCFFYTLELGGGSGVDVDSCTTHTTDGNEPKKQKRNCDVMHFEMGKNCRRSTTVQQYTRRHRHRHRLVYVLKTDICAALRPNGTQQNNMNIVHTCTANIRRRYGVFELRRHTCEQQTRKETWMGTLVSETHMHDAIPMWAASGDSGIVFIFHHLPFTVWP